MTFSDPTALLWLLLAAPIIALYMLRVRLRRVPVSTSMFWKQVYTEDRPQSLWKQLRHLTSLLLQILILLLLTAAVADPWLSSRQYNSRKIVVVVDPSASMQATDVVPTRFDAALRHAHEVIDALGTYDELAIVVAGPSPRVAARMTSHQRLLHQAVDAIEPIDAAACLPAATELAQHLVHEAQSGSVVILTDGCDPVPEENRPDNIEYHTFASDAANVGIIQFQTRRSVTDPLSYEILIRVRNASPGALECRLELDLNDIPVDVLPVNLDPEETWQRSIEKTTADGGILTARLLIEEDTASRASSEAGRHPNDLQVDDIAFSLLAERRIQKVLLVSPGNVFLEKVIEANPLAALKVVGTPPDAWPSDAVIVLHQQQLQQIPDGDVFVVDPLGSSDLWQVGEELRDSIVTTQDDGSPLMNHVHLDRIVFPHARQMALSDPAELLATCATGNPIYALLKRDTGRCLLLNVNLADSDLAFRTAFPILINNALGWFAGEHGELSPSRTTGEVVTLPMIEQHNNNEQLQYRLIHPDGSSFNLTEPHSAAPSTGESGRQTMSVGPLMHAGIYHVEAIQRNANGKSLSTPIAVSLLSTAETDLRPRFRQKETSATKFDEAKHSRPLWFYLAAIAGMLSLTEWGLFNRRYTD